MPGDHVDLSSEPPGGSDERRPGNRAFLGVHFACCGVYARVYRNREGTAYIGHCPRCMRQLKIGIGPGGSDQRFFTVS